MSHHTGDLDKKKKSDSGDSSKKSGSTGSSSSSSSGSTSSTTLKAGSVPFRGIYVFNGNNGSTLATDASIAGTYLGYSWADLEPVQGQYNWSKINNDMAPWSFAGKKVIIRVSTAGWASWGATPSKSWTPSWVYALGSGSAQVQSVTETDEAIKPQYWNALFLQALSDFVIAFGQQFDGNTNIVCIEIGVGDGGETKPDTYNNANRLAMWEKIGYTDAGWWDTIQKICGFYQSAFTHTPLALMPDATFIGGTTGYNEEKVLNYAVANKLWLQNNGLVKGQSINPLFKQAPAIIAEQRNPTAKSGDTLLEDIQLAIDAGAAYFLGFLEDLQKSGNQAVLAQAAALVK